MRGARSLKGIQLVAVLVLLAWPFLVWFGLAHNGLPWLLPALAVVLLIRLRLARHNTGPMRFVMQSVALAGLVLCIASALLGTHQLLLYWPVVVNAVMLAMFGSSLFTRMPLVERLARLQQPDLPPQGVRYTRRVTQIWCGFFIVNGTIALLTAVSGNMPLWSAWNGMVAYLLIGTLMACEWLVRRRVMKREHT